VPPVFTQCVYRFSGLNGNSGLLVPPAGFVWILHQISVYTGATTLGANCDVRDGFTGGTFVHFDFSPTQAGSSQWNGQHAIDELGMDIQTDSPFDVRITAAVLTLP